MSECLGRINSNAFSKIVYQTHWYKQDRYIIIAIQAGEPTGAITNKAQLTNNKPYKRKHGNKMSTVCLENLALPANRNCYQK